MPGNDAPTSIARIRGDEHAREATRLGARGLTFREIADELDMSPAGAHKAVRRGREMIADEIREAAEELRAQESATLDALHEAWLPAALDGDPRAGEIVLKVRRDYRELNDLDLVRERDEPGPTWVVNTALPPEAYEIIDQERPGELEPGAE